ncbi:MAG TPA: methyltransferase domain-containing protein [Thermomicrobiales bacterium]|jgi:SAM-dependent methyltransferase|nr:methyltransferase domain-containing protein [Thermomicrobiales bacterium]
MSAELATPPAADSIGARRDALRERLNQSLTNMLELCNLFLGERLGLYRALAANGPMTSTELAAATDIHERYAREWLEQQTMAGLLATDNPDAGPLARRFHLPPEHAEALADPASIHYWAPQARLGVSLVPALPLVADAFRTGGGVPYHAYGADAREGIADSGRVAYLQSMGDAWLAAMPDVHARLRADPPARIADIGVGAGWTSIAMARAYPKARVDALDLDEASVALARRNVADAGLTDRVRVERRDAADPALAGAYDLVTAFSCLHDMTDPVGALRAMRRLRRPGGTTLVVEGRAAERFLGADTNRDVERQYYGFSVLHCLPVAMTEPPAAGTGTVMWPDVMRGYAREAGFRRVEILPIDDDWNMFYRLWA